MIIYFFIATFCLDEAVAAVGDGESDGGEGGNNQLINPFKFHGCFIILSCGGLCFSSRRRSRRSRS